MEQNEFYEVNGCNRFIPVDLIEEDKRTKELEVVATESGCITFVPRIYKFPKPQEPEKVVVPKVVAEWLEEMKQDDRPLYSVMSSLMNKTNHEWTVWKSSNMNFSEIVAKAYLYGYEIEQEQLYTVEIPNPNSAGGKLVLFKQQSSGRLILDILNHNINKPKYLHLTESEIKEDFEWAWQWAKEVE